MISAGRPGRGKEDELFGKVNRDTFTAGVTDCTVKTRDWKATGAAACRAKSQPPPSPPSPVCVVLVTGRQGGREIIRIAASLALPGNAATLHSQDRSPSHHLPPSSRLPTSPSSASSTGEPVPRRRNSPTATHSPAAGHRELHPATPGSRRNAAPPGGPHQAGRQARPPPAPPSRPGGRGAGRRAPASISLPLASPAACDTLTWRQDQGVPRPTVAAVPARPPRQWEAPAGPPHTAATAAAGWRSAGAAPLPRPSRGCR